MNPRIKELLQKAGMESPDFPYDEFGIPYEQIKFAELFVRECAELVDTKHRLTPEETYDEVLMARWNAMDESAEKIRKHFGVEE